MKSARIQALLRTRPISNEAWAIYVESSIDGRAHLGLAIPKKFAKRAVDRNRLKRAAREAARVKASSGYTQRVIRLKQSVGRLTGGRLRNLEYQKLKSQLRGLV